MIEPVGVGVVGCGDICGIYLKNMGAYKPLRVVACADLDVDKAKKAAEKHGVPKVCSTEELLADSEVELVVNLTVPKAHSPINRDALKAGKHVYSEKPFALSRSDGQETLDLAQSKGLLVGSAPDTFLGAGLQTCRKLIDDGAIGTPVGANGFMMGGGPESWHPSPEFFYEKGGGPLFDMGPYYLTAMVNMLGRIAVVTSIARISFERRTVGSEPKRGKVMTVETPTHIVGVLQFEGGAIGQLSTSFDVCGGGRLPFIEVYGSEGTLSVNDPNNFSGKVELNRCGGNGWEEIPLTHGFAENSRGLGVMDMAYAIRSGRDHRASGARAFHVIDVMQSILEASDSKSQLAVGSSFDRPAPMATDTASDDLGA